MKIHHILILIFTPLLCHAEHKVKVYFEKIENGYSIYADNDEYCPVSIKIDFKLTNLKVENPKNIYVLDALAKKVLVAKLIVDQAGKGFGFNYKYVTNYGNTELAEYDKEYPYDLPFSKSTAFVLFQGYNGVLSHQNENALDFTMPVGTEVTAIREGTVVKVIEHNTKGCGQEDCKMYNNIIIVYHPDGTFVEYTHLKQNGALVNAGDKVTKGQLIGYSGNTGWSTGPHLHLVVFLQKLETRVSVQTKFRTGDGNKAELLVEKNSYSRNY